MSRNDDRTSSSLAEQTAKLLGTLTPREREVLDLRFLEKADPVLQQTAYERFGQAAVAAGLEAMKDQPKDRLQRGEALEQDFDKDLGAHTRQGRFYLGVGLGALYRQGVTLQQINGLCAALYAFFVSEAMPQDEVS